MSNQIQYGFFSAKHARNGADVEVYSNPHSTKGNVYVTHVSLDPLGRDYPFEDKIFEGPVDHLIRKVTVSTNSLQSF